MNLTSIQNFWFFHSLFFCHSYIIFTAQRSGNLLASTSSQEKQAQCFSNFTM